MARMDGEHFYSGTDDFPQQDRAAALHSGVRPSFFVDSAGDVVHVQRGTYRSYAGLLADVRRYLGLAL